MLEHLYKKYKDNDISEIVYKLSYAGKFIIIKGKSLAGSLFIISNTFEQYHPDNKRFKDHLYRHLYDHFIGNEGGRFRIRTLAKKGGKIDHYQILKREQMELDKNRYNPLCLNNAVEAYVPAFNESTNMYGWIERSAVMNFKRWLSSKERLSYIKRYSKMPQLTPAKSGL